MNVLIARLVLMLGLAGCGGGGESGAGTTSGPLITVDQFGYLSSQQKVAVLRDPITGYDSAQRYEPGATCSSWRTRASRT